MARIYTKLPLSITDQVALLKSRGLQFVDEVAAETLLSEVCYFRFVQYLRPMEADNHHSRIWNRRLANAPQMGATMRGAWINATGIDGNKLYAIPS